MRPWDNFFWWVEVDDLPPKTQVDPQNWPPPGGTRPAETTASVNANNGIHVKTGADRVTIWLSPEVVDFKRRISVTVNSTRPVKLASDLEPSLSVLLEDVRSARRPLAPVLGQGRVARRPRERGRPISESDALRSLRGRQSLSPGCQAVATARQASTPLSGRKPPPVPRKSGKEA